MSASFQYLDEETLRTILSSYQENLAELEKKSAAFGPLHIPVYLSNEIKKTNQEIKEIYTEFNKRQQIIHIDSDIIPAKSSTPDTYRSRNTNDIPTKTKNNPKADAIRHANESDNSNSNFQLSNNKSTIPKRWSSLLLFTILIIFLGLSLFFIFERNTSLLSSNSISPQNLNDPISRILSYINDMNGAFADKDIATEAKQEEWADKLSKYFLPTEQAAQKAAVQEALASMGILADMSVKIENVKLEKVSESGDSAEVKFVDGTMTMEFAGQKQEQKLSEIGLVSGGSTSPETVKLQKVDGVWYIVPKSP
jgi:hypothetical protein